MFIDPLSCVTNTVNNAVPNALGHIAAGFFDLVAKIGLYAGHSVRDQLSQKRAQAA